MGKGIGGHTRPSCGESDEWLTPPEILEKIGPFDLDPCAMVNQPWKTATKQYTINDDGLSEPWGNARVFCNPPYGLRAMKWLNKMARHGNGIALVFARTETDMFFESVWRAADGLLFLDRRLHFHHPDGRRAHANSGGPSVLIAYSVLNAHCLRDCGIPGAYIDKWKVT